MRIIRLAIGCVGFLLVFSLIHCAAKKPEITLDDATIAALQALENSSAKFEADLTSGATQITELETALAARMTSQDTSILVRNYVAFLEAASSYQDWEPDADFYGLIDRLRDLPYFKDLPANPPRPVLITSAGETPAAVLPGIGAITLAIPPNCVLQCKYQAVGILLAELGLTAIKNQFFSVIDSGVGCIKDVVSLAECAKDNSCVWGDFVTTIAGCAEFSMNVAFPGAKTSYTIAKAFWTYGTLMVSVADWSTKCMTYQQANCLNCSAKNQVLCDRCDTEQRICHSPNGLDKFCCGDGIPCTECAANFGEFCGSTLCGYGEKCISEEFSICAVCQFECGFSCCAKDQNCAVPVVGLCVPKEALCQGFLCSDETCLPAAKVCDRNFDCPDGGDETLEGCPKGCDGFRCVSGECIGASALCNGSNDCKDGSDEAPSICNAAGDWLGTWAGSYNLTLNDGKSGCTFNHEGDMTLSINFVDNNYAGTFSLTGVQVLQVPGCTLKEETTVSGDLAGLSLAGTSFSASLEGVEAKGTRTGSALTGTLTTPEGSGNFSVNK